jgi:hypothetical protein
MKPADDQQAGDTLGRRSLNTSSRPTNCRNEPETFWGNNVHGFALSEAVVYGELYGVVGME